jgi:hypothetical protein
VRSLLLVDVPFKHVDDGHRSGLLRKHKRLDAKVARWKRRGKRATTGEEIAALQARIAQQRERGE